MDLLSPLQKIDQIFRSAFNSSNLSIDTPLLLAEASRAEFGDYQVNGVMAIAKQLRINPRELASTIINNINKIKGINEVIERVDIAGPGFINIKLNPYYLFDYLEKTTIKNHFNAKILTTDKIIIDYSSPNLAKEMHVGHLRSTIIGDALARIFEYAGNKVIRQNHVGDWGTQFGMLVAYLLEISNNNLEINKQLDFEDKLSDLESYYRQAKKKFDTDLEFANKARDVLVVLQSSKLLKNEYNKTLPFDLVKKYWTEFTKISFKHCNEIYKKLGVKLTDADVRGESFYGDKLESIVDRLQKLGLIVISDGAKCIFFKNYELAGGEETPLIIEKKDGGYLYATTDLAAIDYRVHELGANRLIYVVDARQKLHFEQLFIIAKKAKFANNDTKLEHITFGTMMNENGRPFKTRDGETIKLAELINEAFFRAKALVKEYHPDWDKDEQEKLAEKLAIASIKYADLSKNRNSDYIFSLDKMLAFEGNTAPYLLYAYTRIQSILKKAKENNLKIHETLDKKNDIEIVEYKLLLHLTKFSEVIRLIICECYPHYLCQYLYNLSGIFMQFYESCSILKAENKKLQQRRLWLSSKTAEILKIGLDLLGIEVVEQM